MVSAVERVNKYLNGTPYLLPETGEGKEAARAVTKRLQNIRRKVRRIQDTFAAQRETLLQQVRNDMAIQQVYESNALEGLGLGMRATHDVLSHRRSRTVDDILRDRSVRETIMTEPRVQETLSLDDAYRLAEELVGTPPFHITEADLRNLHTLIVPDESFAGNYKQKEVQIGGSSHRPIPVIDVPAHIRALLDWCNMSPAPPVLKACVAHAWLTHIHPFEDGNGRVARVLANMMLSTHAYPPLVIRSGADRGEYLSALAASDTAGNINYFLSLFSRAINRSVVQLEQPEVTRELLLKDIYGKENSEYLAWGDLVFAFSELWRDACATSGFVMEEAGHIVASDFYRLRDYDASGNGWFLKIRRPETRLNILVWFGFNTIKYRDMMGTDRVFPSLFFSERDRAPLAQHPYRPLLDSGRFTIDELVLIPGVMKPAVVRRGLEVYQLELGQAVDQLMSSFIHHENLLIAD